MVKKQLSSNFPYIAIVALVAVVAVVVLVLNVGRTAGEETVEIVDEEGNVVGEAFRMPTLRKIPTLRKAPTLCTDSDFGTDYFRRGTVTALGLSQTDYCVSNSTLNEFYCSQPTSFGNLTNTTLVRALHFDCGRLGLTCSAGACVRSSASNGVYR